MIQYKNRRAVRAVYAAVTSMTILTGFTSLAAEPETENITQEDMTVQNSFAQPAAQEESREWTVSAVAGDIHRGAFEEAMAAAEKAQQAYIKKKEEERKAEEEAKRIAKEKAEEEAAARAEKELLAALIFCEAGNQPYEGQVAVGAVVMNRVRSGAYPNNISDVIYQSGQFTPAMTGWLDSVLANKSYTESAMQAAADALAGGNPVGECLYFSTGGYGIQIGDHYFH